MNLRLENVTHRYGEVEVLRGIDLDIPTGKIVCVVGPSGCGKSTLLRLIGGLERPDGGRIVQVGDPRERRVKPLLCHGTTSASGG